MAARGADQSSLPAMNWRIKGETIGFLSVRKREIDTNANDTWVLMLDACNDHGRLQTSLIRVLFGRLS